jgi:DNA topoisomerase IA
MLAMITNTAKQVGLILCFLAAFASGVLADGPHPRQGKKTDNAHPPIHPTKYTNNLQVSV